MNQELLLRNEYLAAENLSMANYKIRPNTVVFEVSVSLPGCNKEVGATSGVGNPGTSAPDTLLTIYICGLWSAKVVKCSLYELIVRRSSQ